MNTSTPTTEPAPVKRRAFTCHVTLADGTYRSLTVEADAPETAAAEALLTAHGPTRPLLCPGEVSVDGTAYEVDEWLDARAFVIPTREGGAERLRIERTLVHLRRTSDALDDLASTSEDPADARAARYDAAEVGRIAARLRSVSARRGGAP
jgi:hypothetical protein